MEIPPEDKTEFPLHNLDYVTLTEIYKSLGLKDIFELSFTTKEVKRSLSEASKPIKSMIIDFDPKMPTITIKTIVDEFSWTFGYPENLPLEQIENEYKIGRFAYECKQSKNGYHTLHHDMEAGMIAVIRYMVTIFDFSDTIIEGLSIDLAVIGDSRAIGEHFKNFKKTQRFAVHETVDNETNRLNFTQNCDSILSSLRADEVYIGVDLVEHRLMRTSSGDFDFQAVPTRLEKLLSTDHICLKYAEWITPEDLLNLDVETAILGVHRLTERDLNAFMKKWLSSDSLKLCWLEVKIDKNFQKEVALEGLETRPDTYRQYNFKCSCPYRRYHTLESVPFMFPANSLQIIRPNQLDTATISITDELFFFHVGNDGPVSTPTENERQNEQQNAEQAARQENADRALEIVQQNIERIVQQNAEQGIEERVNDGHAQLLMFDEIFEDLNEQDRVRRHEHRVVNLRRHGNQLPVLQNFDRFRVELQLLQDQREQEHQVIVDQHEAQRARRRERMNEQRHQN